MSGHKERFTLIASAYVFFRRDDEILLLRRFNTGYEDGNYSVPAGHLDGNEDLLAGAIREAHEEIGVTLRRDQLRVAGVMHRLANDERMDIFVEARDWEGELVNREPEKCDDLSWFPLDALPTNTIPYIRRAIELTVADIGMWFEMYGWPAS